MSADLEIREATDSDSEWILEGYASKFDTPYTVADRQGNYTETVRRGAFRGTLARDPDTLLLVSHGGNPLARTKPSRTLTLAEDATGLHVRARLDKADPAAQSAVSMVRRGTIGQMSFSFRVDGKSGQRWSEDWASRELLALDVDHGDVSLTPFGASPSTEVAVRGAGTQQERRALAESIGLRVNGYTPSGLAIAETRAGRYAAHELAQLGAQGQAFGNPDGHWSFPTPTREDLLDAVRDIGRAPTPLRSAVRKYLYGRARDMGLLHLLPPTWASDGSVKQFGSRSDSTLEAQLRQRLRDYGYRPGGTRTAEAELRARVTVALARNTLLEAQLRRRAGGR